MRWPFLLIVLSICPAAVEAQLPHGIPDFCQGSRSGVPAGQAQTWAGTRTMDCVGVHGTLVLQGELRATTIMVYPGGHLDLQSGSAIVIRSVPPTDPEQYGTGLLVFGRLTGAGDEKTAFVRLDAEAPAGSTTVTLGEPVSGWTAGDRVVIPGTNQHWPASVPYRQEWETRTIAAIAGNVVTLDAPLAYDHGGARDHTGAVRFLPHIGNLSRSVVIRSENPSGARGHVLFSGDAQIDLRYVRFQDLGRTTIQPVGGGNVKGRYPVHLHMPNPAAHMELIGSVVEGGPKWGIFVHAASGNVVRDNVVFNVGGAGIGTEDGSESGNIFDHNFAVAVWGTGDDRADNRLNIQDYGFEGSPFWFRSPNNQFTRNVGANSNSYCVSWFMIGGTGNAEATPFGTIDGNECYSTFFGMTIWHYLARCGVDVFEGPEVAIRNSVLWHIGKIGYYGYCSNRLTFDGWTQINRTDLLSNPHEGHHGFNFGDYITSNTKILNAYISGTRNGVVAPFKVGDQRNIYGGAPGTLLIENGQFHVAFEALQMATQYGVVGGGPNLTPRIVAMRNVTVGGGRLAGLGHFTDGTNPNPNVSDRLILSNAAGLTGEAYRAIQAREPFYGGLAPSNATQHPMIDGLFSPTGGPMPPLPPPAPPTPPPTPPPPSPAPPASSAGCASPNGARGVAITDMSCGVWTLGPVAQLGGYPPLRDGVAMAPPHAAGVEYWWHDQNVYLRNMDDTWFRWTGVTWEPSSISVRTAARAQPVDCRVSGWSAWSPWTLNPDGKSESRTRKRTVVGPAVNGGAPCGALRETEHAPFHANRPHQRDRD